MKILLISLSNIGDVILTFPVFDSLSERFPNAKISVVVGNKAQSLFTGNPRVGRLYVYDKLSSITEKIEWLNELRREKFDLIVDLRNSMLPFMVRSRKSTRPVFLGERNGHMKDTHFRRSRLIVPDAVPAINRHSLHYDKTDMAEARSALANMGDHEYVVVGPGAADDRKRWPADRFAQLIGHIIRKGLRVVIVGDKNDGCRAEALVQSLPDGVINTCGLLTLKQVALVLQKASFAVLNDTGIMHMASYLNVPVIALFGPTDPSVYGPWSTRSVAIRKGERMDSIAVDDVMAAVERIKKEN